MKLQFLKNFILIQAICLNKFTIIHSLKIQGFISQDSYENLHNYALFLKPTPLLKKSRGRVIASFTSWVGWVQ